MSLNSVPVLKVTMVILVNSEIHMLAMEDMYTVLQSYICVYDNLYVFKVYIDKFFQTRKQLRNTAKQYLLYIPN